MPGTRPQPQPGKQGNKTRPTPTLRPTTRNTQPKMADPSECKLRASIGTKWHNHQHPCQPSKNDRAKPSCGSPRANATITPHILPYIGRGTSKTTNPKHTPPTRNHSADKQTPPQFKSKRPNATAEPSDARPAAPTHGGQSHHTQDHRPNTTARHTAEDRMQQ
ncbi:hypothetical protein AMECASPLE_026176 [Ameca splendens]|uniref:Uncharacterized protein n=1 Tax=Ameca splendens TaxID=208324 RepID=A0ABV0YH25_9TELE